jgi:hypoxanthine phosphoribosyltransferase
MLIRPLYSAEQVEARIDEIARQLDRDYADSPFSLLCIDPGARRFVDGLLERLARNHVSCDLQPIRARRTAGTTLSPVQVDAFDASVRDHRDVLVVDDMADEGVTLRAILELVEFTDARSIRTAVLIDKRERRREAIPLDYVGFVVESGWVVGYGMDIDGEFRELDEIGIVTEA